MKDILKVCGLYFGMAASLVVGFNIGGKISNKIDEIAEKRSNKIDNGTEENA